MTDLENEGVAEHALLYGFCDSKAFSIYPASPMKHTLAGNGKFGRRKHTQAPMNNFAFSFESSGPSGSSIFRFARHRLLRAVKEL